MVRQGCSDPPTLQAILVSQVDAARDADVELSCWSHKMSYGGAFRDA